jgi:hypothetical protein
MPQNPEPATDATAHGKSASGSAAKRPYVRPGITFREPLEAIAVVCTVGPGNPAKAISGVDGCVIATS